MDNTGHTTLAEWTAADPASVEAAVAALRAELDQGYYAVVNHGEGRAELRRLFGVPEDRFVIGWIGRMTGIKRVDDLHAVSVRQCR